MERTIHCEVFGDNVEAKISKKGVAYLRATVVTKGEDGRIDCFMNACFFPEADSLQELRGYLVRGRELEITGNYSEREYEGKDGTMKTSHDILVHEVKLGGIAQYDGEQKATTYSFIRKEDEAEAKKGAAKEAAKAAAKPAKPAPTTKIGVIPEGAPAKVKKGAKTAGEAVFSDEGEEDFNIEDLDI